MSGVKFADNITKLKTAFFKPVLPEQAKSKANTNNQVSPTAVQERQGVSEDMQSFLLKRALKGFGEQFGKNTPSPTPTEPPTYPNAPLFSKGEGDTDSVDYDDVSQGSQNNCFLMAAIAALAKNDPQAIHDMIDENHDADGNVTSYTVTLYKDGKENKVEVLPSEILSNGANPADNDEIWVAVIEAAYAKLNGGTDTWKNGGSAAGALETLTGKPSQNHGVDGSDYSFEDLQNDVNSGKNVTLVTPGEKDDKKGKVKGSPYNLHNWHFYVVEKVYVDEKTGQQMVQLYNPWGSDHPKPIPFDELDNYFSQFQTN